MIAKEKLISYLLNASHKRGGAKARLLEQFGYGRIIISSWPMTFVRNLRPKLKWNVQLRTEYAMKFG